MATIIFDGSTSQTATKTDTVVLTANPANFTSAAELNGNVVLTFGSQTLTVTGTTLVAGGLPGVSIPNGAFNYATTADATSNVAGNTLSFLLGTGTTTTIGGSNTTANSVNAAFGGLGRADSLDGAETVSIAAASKGSFLIYGNAGGDSISAAANALDSNTATTVFGGRGVDTINLGTQNGVNANFAVYGGEDGDSISLNHTGTGSATIFGGTAAADPTDGADSINLGTGTAGTITVYAGAGNDIITSDGTAAGTAATFAAGATGSFFGGNGSDTITVGGTGRATILVAGGADGDTISATNVTGGTTTVFGGTGAADSADGADSITVAGGGSFAVYGNAGNDTIVATGLTAAGDSTTTNLTVFGGLGDDSVNAGSTLVKANYAIYGSENGTLGDTIAVANAAGGSTIVYGGTAAADSADGRDVITVTGGGTVTIYAAGGNDSVDLTGGNSIVDTTNAISVFGGAGNDTINVGTQLTNTQGTVTIDAGAGADSILISSTAVGTSTTATGTGITINNFVTGAAGDRLQIDNGTRANTVTTVDGSSAQTLQQALDLAATSATAGQVTAVVFQGNAYVVIDNDTGTSFLASNDQAIKLTGLTDVAAVAAAITVI